MTLVLTVVTGDVVMQASDRRLVHFLPGGRTSLKDDESNKAVLFGNRVVFAYTGLAEMGPIRQSTDLWLADVLHRVTGDQADALDDVAAAATQRFKHPLLRRLPPEMRLHEFAAAGWARWPSDGRARFDPYVAVVTNMRNREDGSVLGRARDDFFVWWQRLRPENTAMAMVTGVQLTAEENAALMLRIEQVGASPPALAQALVEQIRAVAARSDAVGESILVSSFPRKSVEDPGPMPGLLLLGGPMENQQTFLHVPGNADDPIRYGPTIVAPEGGVVSGFVAGPAGKLPGGPSLRRKNS